MKNAKRMKRLRTIFLRIHRSSPLCRTCKDDSKNGALPGGCGLALRRWVLPAFMVGAIGTAANAQTQSLQLCLADPPAANDSPAGSRCEHAIITDIHVRPENIFDTSDPEENNFLFRIANALHIVTVPSVIESQLLFKPGDEYSSASLNETERLLRANSYIRSAEVDAYKNRDGNVEVDVTTHDVWSISTGLSYGRKGGKNSGGFGIEDENFLGQGNRISYERSFDVDRTKNIFRFADPQLFGSRWLVDLRAESNSDGSFGSLNLERPFYALNTENAYGIEANDDLHITPIYRLGKTVDEFEHHRKYLNTYAGWSSGLVDGWVSRWTVGATYDDNQFATTDDYPLSTSIPDPRTLVYPWISYELLQNSYLEMTNHQRIGRVEDVYVGTRLSAKLGVASENWGSDRDAMLLSLSAENGVEFDAERMAFFSLGASGRLERSGMVNRRVDAAVRYYQPESPRWVFYTALRGTFTHDRDADTQLLLGGDNGLRGYPLRYQEGDRQMVFTLEQRFYSGICLFNLFDIGGAVFFDAGRSWKNENSLTGGDDNLGVLKDVGFGLRIGNNRSSHGAVLHMDVAFPLDGDSSIDSMQLLIEAKNEF